MSAVSGLYARLAENFQSILIVKAFGMERQERREVLKHSRDIIQRVHRNQIWRGCLKPLAEVTGVTVVGVGLIVGGYLVVGQHTHIAGIRLTAEPLSPTAMMVFFAMLLGTVGPLQRMAGLSVTLQRTIAAVERISRLMQRQPKVKDPVSPIPLPMGPLAVQIEQAKYSYSTGPLVLNGLSLDIQPGECVGLVGPSGGGKSTLINLLLRFFDTQEGSVRVGGFDVRDVRVRDLRNRLSLVSQRTLSFDDTVFNNILYGQPDATARDVYAAAQRAGADEFISTQLDEGYETKVGESGSQISGGQAQRIALAREILRDPSLLILDEATSNVDLKTELVIQRELKSFIQDRTTLIVTHRPSTLQLADRIAVVEQGRIVAVGRHEQLLENCAFYQQMCAANARAA